MPTKTCFFGSLVFGCVNRLKPMRKYNTTRLFKYVIAEIFADVYKSLCVSLPPAKPRNFTLHDGDEQKGRKYYHKFPAGRNHFQC